MLKKPICNAANRNDFILGSDGSIYKCTMLFNEEFNKIGVLQPNGILQIDESKLSRWVMGEVEPVTACSDCPEWNLCFNRSCPAAHFSLSPCQSGNCGYEKKSIDYVLKLLYKANSKYMKKYE